MNHFEIHSCFFFSLIGIYKDIYLFILEAERERDEENS